jgi:hypothetical protein
MRTILEPPMPPVVRPLWALPAAAAVAILPRFARRAYGLRWFDPATPPVRAAVFGFGRVLDLVFPEPPLVRAARARVQAA